MSDRARDNLNVTLFKYFIRDKKEFPQPDLFSFFQSALSARPFFLRWSRRGHCFHPNSPQIVPPELSFHQCIHIVVHVTLFLLPRRSTDLSVAESAQSEPAWSFELNFRENPFFVEREFPFSKKIIFFFKISRMKVVYLGIHWQSDIRSWINLSNPKLEIQLSWQSEKTKTFCLFHMAVTLCCWQASIL